MHEDGLKVYDLWKKEQVRDGLLAEWAKLNGAVKRFKDEQQAKADEAEALTSLQAALRERERDANRRNERYVGRRAKAQKAIDTGTATDFGLAQEQVAKCTDLLDDVDTELLELYEELENVETNIDAVQRVHAQKGQLLVAAETARTERKRSLKEEFDVATSERDAARPGVWRDHLGRYDRLRAKKLHPFAPLVDGNCGGCMVGIAGVDLSAHKRGAEVGICKHCGRFLGE
jgi:predicted  nucleic acid-binding Zn-ribbon protein